MKDYIATLQELLQGRNEEFDQSNAIALVRHADSRKELLKVGNQQYKSLHELYRYAKSHFMAYQSEQCKGKFEKYKFIVATLGEKGTKTRFLTVYRINGITPDPQNPENGVILDLEEMPEFKILSEKLIFDWGKATVAWVQNFREQIKYVTDVDVTIYDPSGLPKFSGHENIIVDFPSMKKIFNGTNREWIHKLQVVNCIYCITDKNTGKNYVGETHGSDGIWGRWQCYVDTNGHGGNVRLMKLIQDDPDYATKHFQWHILRTLPLTVTHDEAIEIESLYKEKLQTRQFGYNDN